jgi:anti-sigma factor RsiW
MEHEEAYILMMEALDGELSDTGRHNLEAHLHGCPLCSREWHAIQAIDTLLRQTPALSPAADFAHRTLARLPNRRYRLWMISGLYGLLLVSGFLPVIALLWLAIAFGPAIGQPAIVRSVLESAGQVIPVILAILNALWQTLGGFGALLGQQPAIIGWLLIMAGLVTLWGSMYTQLMRPRYNVIRNA